MEKKNESERFDIDTPVIRVRNEYSDKATVSMLRTPLLLTIEHYDFNKDFFLFSWIGLNYFSTKTYRISDPKSHRTKLHRHDNFEILYVIKGQARLIIDSYCVDVQHGECIIINRNIPHLEKPNENCEFVLLSLSNHFFTSIIVNDFVITENNEIIRRKCQIYDEIVKEMARDSEETHFWKFMPTVDTKEITSKTELKFAEMVTTMNQRADGYYFHMQELIVQFFCFINSPYMYQMQKFSNSVTKTEKLFRQIKEILEERDGLISRAELSKKMNYDDHHLNRIVQKTLGVSLVEYARYFTMKKSAALLTETDMTIEEIINQLGFSNKTYFFNLFKKTYNLTPKQYRELYRKKE